VAQIVKVKTSRGEQLPRRPGGMADMRKTTSFNMVRAVGFFNQLPPEITLE
jgi:hypothetical protein